MNRVIWSDKIWKIYFSLPWCLFNIKKNEKKARKKFNYETESDVSIISVNCVGGEIYSILGLKFMSPFINVTMKRKDFILLSTNFKEYMLCPLKIEKENEIYYGILHPNRLKPIKIGFPHAEYKNQIVEEWDRRKERINYNKLIFICDDQGLDKEDFQLFDTVKAYKKILFTSKNVSEEFQWAYQLKAYKKQRYTGAYNAKSFLGGWKFQYMWDFVSFLNGTNDTNKNIFETK